MSEESKEDPNIATLREAIRMLPREEVPYVIRELQDRANEALSAMATALAEKEARLRDWQKVTAQISAGAELATQTALSREEELRAANTRIRELEARLAVPEGELAEQRENLWTLIRNYRVEHVGDLVGVAGAIDRILEPLFGAASAWARLQWRKASEAPSGVRALFIAEPFGEPGRRLVCLGERDAVRDVWLDEETDGDGDHFEWQSSEVRGHILASDLLDALPQLPPTPGASDG